jgi:hypothetical protein
MSSKFFGNKNIKESDNTRGSKSKPNSQNPSKTTAVRKTGRGK